MKTPPNGNVLTHRVATLEGDVEDVQGTAAALAETVGRHEEQISGERGLVKAMVELRDEIKALRRSAWGVAASIVTASVVVLSQLPGKL